MAPRHRVRSSTFTLLLVNDIVKWSQETAEEKRTKKIKDARKKKNDSSKWEDLARKAMEYEEKETRLQEVGNKKRKVKDKKNDEAFEKEMVRSRGPRGMEDMKRKRHLTK